MRWDFLLFTLLYTKLFKIHSTGGQILNTDIRPKREKYAIEEKIFNTI